MRCENKEGKKRIETKNKCNLYFYGNFLKEMQVKIGTHFQIPRNIFFFLRSQLLILFGLICHWSVVYYFFLAAFKILPWL